MTKAERFELSQQDLDRNSNDPDTNALRHVARAGRQDAECAILAGAAYPAEWIRGHLQRQRRMWRVYASTAGLYEAAWWAGYRSAVRA